MKEQHDYFAVGIDPGLTECGIAVVARTSRGGVWQLLRTAVVGVEPGDDRKGERYHEYMRGIEGQLVAAVVQPMVIDAVYCEGYSYGSPHAARRIGENHGILHLGLYETTGCNIEYVTPYAVKEAACPDWPGFSKANWAKAKRKGAWKRSTPDKSDVVAGLFRRFRISVATDAEADAVLVAIVGAVISAGNIADKRFARGG